MPDIHLAKPESFLKTPGANRAAEVFQNFHYQVYKLTTYNVIDVSEFDTSEYFIPLHPDLFTDNDFVVFNRVDSGAEKFRAGIKLGKVYIEGAGSGEKDFIVNIYTIISDRKELKPLFGVDNTDYFHIEYSDLLPIALRLSDDRPKSITNSEISVAKLIREDIKKLISGELVDSNLMAHLEKSLKEFRQFYVNAMHKKWEHLPEEDATVRLSEVAKISPVDKELMARQVEENDHWLTPAAVLWLSWIRNHSKNPLEMTVDGEIAPLLMGDFERAMNDTYETKKLPITPVINEKIKRFWLLDKNIRMLTISKDEGLALPIERIQERPFVTFDEFQRLMDIFSRPETHFRFQGAIRTAFIRARSVFPEDPIARVQHVTQALFQTASAIFADAVNSSLAGGVNGAFVPFLLDDDVEKMLKEDGRPGAFLLHLSKKNPTNITVSYVALQEMPVGAGDSLSPRILQQLIITNKSKNESNTYVLGDVKYKSLAEAVANNSTFLKHPCLKARLTVRLGSTEAAEMTVPIRNTPPCHQFSSLFSAGCGEIDPTNFNQHLMARIYKAICLTLKVKSSDDPIQQILEQQKAIFDQGSITLIPNREDPFYMLALPKDAKEALHLNRKVTEYLMSEFNGFHGLIDYDEVLNRLKGKPSGTFILRSSLNTTDGMILCFVATDLTVQQALIEPDRSLESAGKGRVICSGVVFDISILTLLLSYARLNTPGSPDLLNEIMEPYGFQGKIITARPWVDLPWVKDALSKITLTATTAPLPESSFSIDELKALRSVWSSLVSSRRSVLLATEASAGAGGSSMDAAGFSRGVNTSVFFRCSIATSAGGAASGTSEESVDPKIASMKK